MWLEVWQGGDKTSTEFGVMEFEALSSEARCSEPDIRSGILGVGLFGGILEFDEPGGIRMLVLMVQNWSRILLHKSRAIARKHSYLCFFLLKLFQSMVIS